MANPDEQSNYEDPEMEALLVNAPLDKQQTIRDMIKNLRSTLSSEVWLAIRSTIMSDLKSHHDKQHIEKEMTEIKNEMHELEEGIKQLEELRKKLNSLGKN